MPHPVVALLPENITYAEAFAKNIWALILNILLKSYRFTR
jgi:hypothetical protein